MSEAHLLGSTPATDEVIDAIAEIEMQRRETEKQAGFAMSCSSALHRLNELLGHETEALRLRGPEAGHPQNVETVKIEIGRVKGLASPKGQNSFRGNGRTEQRPGSWSNTPLNPNPARNKGRRAMGRRGAR